MQLCFGIILPESYTFSFLRGWSHTMASFQPFWQYHGKRWNMHMVSIAPSWKRNNCAVVLLLVEHFKQFFLIRNTVFVFMHITFSHKAKIKSTLSFPFSHKPHNIRYFKYSHWKKALWAQCLALTFWWSSSDHATVLIRKKTKSSVPSLPSFINSSLAVSLISNRSRTPQIYTSPTCLCPWMSRSWRTCWNPSVRPFPLASSVMPTGPVEEWALPGRSFG